MVNTNQAQLEQLRQENEQLKKENDTILKIMELMFTLTGLWAKQKGLIDSDLKAEENVAKELADRKEEVRTIFNDLIKSGEPAFVDRFLRALNLPEDLKHLI